MLRTRVLFVSLHTGTDVFSVNYIYLYMFVCIYLKIESAKHKPHLITEKMCKLSSEINTNQRMRRIFYCCKE